MAKLFIFNYHLAHQPIIGAYLRLEELVPFKSMQFINKNSITLKISFNVKSHNKIDKTEFVL